MASFDCKILTISRVKSINNEEVSGGTHGDPAASTFHAHVSFAAANSNVPYVEKDCIVRDVAASKRNCCALEPVIGSAEFAIGSLRGHKHVVNMLGFLSAGGRGREHADSPDYTKPTAPLIPRSVSYSVIFQPVTTTAHELVVTNKLPTGDFLRILLYQYAKGVKEIHSSGFYHLDLNLANLVLHEGVGYIRSTASAVAAPSNTVHSKAPRALAYFRPPENFLADASGVRFATHVFDVWSLGLCFFTLITRRGVFRINEAPGLLSTRSLEALQAFRKSPHSNQTFENLFLTRECVSWQTLSLFGSYLPHSDPTGPSRRKIFLTKSFHAAADSGYIYSEDVDIYVDLLFRMLNPDHTHRATINDVVGHPAFHSIKARADAASHIIFPKIECGIYPSGSMCSAFTWNSKRDQIVVGAMRAAIYHDSVRHISAECAFVAFDNAMRIVGALPENEDPRIIAAAAAAAVRVSLLLYDASTSIYQHVTDVNTAIGEGSPTHAAAQALESVVLEFLSTELRRDIYFSRLTTEMEAVDIFGLMFNPQGKVFRSEYLKSDPATVLNTRFGVARLPHRSHELHTLLLGRLIDSVKLYDEVVVPAPAPAPVAV